MKHFRRRSAAMAKAYGPSAAKPKDFLTMDQFSTM
jgi:hypothetical protein